MFSRVIGKKREMTLDALEELLGEMQALSVELGGERGRGVERACELLVKWIQRARVESLL